MYGESLPNRGFRRGTTPLCEVENSNVHDLTPDTPLHLAGPEDQPRVPLPNEIPPPPNLASLPSHVLHSGTVESLIAQNEDLMARLKVNLRRNALLEQRIFEIEDVLDTTQQENESLKDQALIVQEKDRIWKEKNAALENKFDNMEEESELLRQKLFELEMTSEDRIQTLQQRMQVLQSYMRRVRRWVRPSLDRLHAEGDRDRIRITELVHHLENLRKDLAASDLQAAELKARIEKLIRFEREREGMHQQDQARLVDSYETRLREKTELCEKLGADMKYFKDRSQRLDAVTRKQVESENRSILMERKAQELERRLATEVLEFQTQTATYRGEAKALAVELESLRNEMRRERDERERAEADNQRMTDQLESLQALWGESRKENESLQLRLESLNKINQELSRKLKEQRIERENENLELKPTFAIAPHAPAPKPAHDIEKLNKLDVLLATIESGFPVAPAPEIQKMRTLDFVEDEDDENSRPEVSL